LEVSVINQANIFLFAVAGGMLIAFIYDIFRIKRKTVKTRSFGVFIEDFVFWVLVALIMFAVVYFSNEGEVRGYIFLGAAIGIVLYSLLLSRLVMKLFLAVIGILKRIFKGVWFVISYPFRIVIRILKVPCGFMAKISRKAARRVNRVRKSQFAKLYIWKKMIKNKIKKI